ncbi:MAG: type I DNA topoisomerase [Planctomycetes bacterium]|nr:type I DNA topoisomerase [Planctomycetota bacterium]
MAKKRASHTGNSLVIVESPAKAKTIGKFLGSDFTVEASIGHIRDLPQGAKEIPAQYKKESWAHLGVNVDNNFDPIYVISEGKSKQVTKLRQLLKDADHLYLATDEDREEQALANPREIDDNLVRAQEARRIIDRLYGYEVSPLLWRKVRPKLSAGRVQSVAVRLIVEREKARMAFVTATYWDLAAILAKGDGQQFRAALVSVDGRNVPEGKDFDSATGKLKDPSLLLLDEAGATALLKKLEPADFKVASIEDKPYTSRPYPPFTTSTLQQEANRKLGFTARRTMGVAQSLYQNGHITYMRTDSTTLSKVAIDAARDLVTTLYGPEYLPAEPRQYSGKVKNAQEAHEAIRPAGHPFEKPEVLRSQLTDDEFRLFELIWKRTIASQMLDARGRSVSVSIEGAGAVFQASGKTIEFPGYFLAYVEGSDDPKAELADKETVLPDLARDERLRCAQLESKSHTTQPPARFTEASLTKELEKMGIGRPSTYASIIETIQDRNYVFKKGQALVPAWVAFAVSQLLTGHLPELVDYQFTAQMEDDLDSISRGEANWVDYLSEFYFGKRGSGLKKLVSNKAEEIDAREISRIKIGRPPGEDGKPGEGAEIVVRVGRYGPFLEQGERRASIPEDLAPDEMSLEAAVKLLDSAQQSEEPLGICPDTLKPVYLKMGRFGPYIQRGIPDDEEKPKNASLMKGMNPQDVDLATALKLLSLPRDLGPHPENGQPIIAQNGRFGPYIKCGDDTRSLPADVSPIDVTFEQAVELLAQPKAARRGFGAKREPLKAFNESPVTKQPVQLFEGRYGLYVTDGETNASLQKGTSAEALTFEEALNLLAERAAKGPPVKKGRFARRGGGKKAAGSEDSTATAPAKKGVKKKSAAKKKGAGKKPTPEDSPF